ncbi:MAG: DGQHR domain-containing protein [Paracoccaceae bacterium]|nr:DGQHR domain-containing protein [Paracoccaceae bacterium]MDE2674536.1 DGQHR domain-containing protein [Paracoccaceae bacterium]
MSFSKIRVVRGPTLRQGISTVVGIIPASALVLHHYVPHRDVLKNIGYQRNPTGTRISKLAHDLLVNKVDLPTSVLLNLRNDDVESVLIKQSNDNYILQLDPEKAEDEHRLFVVDGQHRIRALEKAINELGADISNIKIPFVCMIGADESREMEQFHIVNSNAKSVPTDLALDLLKARYEQDPNFKSEVIEKSLEWQVEAQKMTELLTTNNTIWKGRIRLPNTPKGETIVPSASFARSLKPLLSTTTLFSSIKDTNKQVQILDTYWKGINRILPEAFENPSKFSLQKGVGVDVMHSILLIVMDLVRTNNDSLFKPESFADFLEDALLNLEGRNGFGESVSGIDFWRAGRDGAAGSYTSAGGKKRLSEYLNHLLPDLVL